MLNYFAVVLIEQTKLKEPIHNPDNHLKFIENDIIQDCMHIWSYLIIVIIKLQWFCEEILQVFRYHTKDFRTQLLILLIVALLPRFNVWLKCSLILVLWRRAMASALICKTKIQITPQQQTGFDNNEVGKLLPC